MSSASFETGLTLAVRYLIPFVLLSFALWWTLVNSIVTEPYLDEVFHVGQAQTYWAGNWTQWDPKITTPPGLYIWSYLICAGLLLVRGSPENVGASELRATNVVAAALVMPWRLQTLLDLLRKERNTRPSGAWISHTVLNICLFPPLLFFSALYYTDILALLAVVEAYIWDVNRSERTGTKKSWFAALSANVSLQSTGFLVVGLAALVVRQTNIFWVAVFMGGLQAVRTLRQNTTACKDQDPAQIVMKSFQGQLYDPLVEDASFLGELGVQFSCSIALLIRHRLSEDNCIIGMRCSQ
jgi:alpha-1,2-glucosyltransferase